QVEHRGHRVTETCSKSEFHLHELFSARRDLNNTGGETYSRTALITLKQFRTNHISEQMRVRMCSQDRRWTSCAYWTFHGGFDRISLCWPRSNRKKFWTFHQSWNRQRKCIPWDFIERLKRAVIYLLLPANFVEVYHFHC